VLFDEIEKAHPEVFNALLQILDDGRLTDGQGRTVDFKNTVVIMTSNVASSELRRAARIGFALGSLQEAEQESMQAKAKEGLKRAFRPEFLNRIDQIVVFQSLGKDDLRHIVDLLLHKVADRLREQGIGLMVGEDVRDFLMTEGYDEQFGARPLRRAIQNHIDDTLADAILSGSLASGQNAKLTMVEGKVTVEAMDTVPVAA
jgi:ATP-dependent Clp protease ATP-binding subunit ClpC